MTVFEANTITPRRYNLTKVNAVLFGYLQSVCESSARQSIMLTGLMKNTEFAKVGSERTFLLSANTSLPIPNSNDVETYSFSFLTAGSGNASIVSTSRGVAIAGQNGFESERGYTLDVITIPFKLLIYPVKSPSGNSGMGTGIGFPQTAPLFEFGTYMNRYR